MMPEFTKPRCRCHIPKTPRAPGRFLGLGTLLLAAACGSTPDAGPVSQDPGPPAPAATATSTDGLLRIEMRDDMTFDPASPTVAVGDTILWVNVGGMPHTSTNQPGRAAVPEHTSLPEGAEGWDSGLVDAGGEMRIVPSVPGQYAYFCSLHEALGMVATVTVTPR